MDTEKFIRESEAISIVILGSFNPAIFHPLWFSNSNLIRPGEAEKAIIEIVHNEAAIFKTDWFNLQVMTERFSIDTSDGKMFYPLRDLVSGTFKMLEHSPVTAMGLNSSVHYRISSMDIWHKVGHTLAPKEFWNDLLENPGMRSLAIEGQRRGSESHQVTARIEPSGLVKPGVFFSVNQHYALSSPQGDGRGGCRDLLRLLDSEWESFVAYHRNAAETLLSKAT